MPFIRIGRFDEFGGDAALLIEGDQTGLKALIGEIQQLQTSFKPLRLNDHPHVTVYGGFRCILEVVREDRGLVVVGALGVSWRRSLDGWSSVVEKLRVLAESMAGHHYLDRPSDDLQVIAAIGEYGQAWWDSHAG